MENYKDVRKPSKEEQIVALESYDALAAVLRDKIQLSGNRDRGN